MVIRGEQLEAFRRHAEAGFERECCEHLCAYVPVLARESGVEAFRSATRSGLGKARTYGLYQRGAAQLYLELTVTLGGEFDTDPQYAWLMSVISGTTELTPRQRSEIIYWHVARFIEQSCGPGNEFAHAALRRLAGLDSQRIREVAEGFETRALSFMQWLYPEKLEFIGESAFTALLRASVSAAEQNGLPAAGGSVLAAALAVVFGYAVLGDPIHAWARRAIDDAGGDPNTKLNGLLGRTVALARQLGEGV